MGTTERLEYTALGETVNLASRIEGKCREVQAAVIASETTERMLPRGAFGLRALGEHRLRGHEQPVALFHVVGPLVKA